MTVAEFMKNPWANAPTGTYHIKVCARGKVAHVTGTRQGYFCLDDEGQDYFGPRASTCEPSVNAVVDTVHYLVTLP